MREGTNDFSSSGLWRRVWVGLVAFCFCKGYLFAGAEQAAPDTDRTEAALHSEAELVVFLQQSMSRDEQRLKSQQEQSERLGQLFEQISGRAKSFLTEETPSSPEEAGKSDEEEVAGGEDSSLRFELEIVLQRRQASERQTKVLEAKLETQKVLLDLILLGGGAELLASAREGTNSVEPDGGKESRKGTTSEIVDTLVPGISAATAGSAASGEEQRGAEVVEPNYSLEVLKARQEVQAKEARIQDTQRRISLLDRLISLNEADLSLAEVLSRSSKRAMDFLSQAIEDRQNVLDTLATEDKEGRNAVENRLAELKALVETTKGVASRDLEVVQLQKLRIESLVSFREPVYEQVTQLGLELEKARYRLAMARSPLAPHNVKRWLFESGPKLILIVLVLIALWIALRSIARRIFERIVRGRGYSTEQDRMERVDTLVRVFRNSVTIVVFCLGLILVLPEFGVDLTVLLGGAAVLSLAVAFGAQALVKDYFSGVMILMENQYRVGNVIRVNNVAGLVEDVTLRVTMLRDLDGIAHFIPHGQITSVSNLSHGWSRAVFDVGVAYKENVDRVMEVLLELAVKMRNDLEYGPYIIEDPEMLGVDQLGDSAVVIKFVMKTRPLKQFMIRREMLRRIKNRFDELGIEIPFPHRTVYHRELDTTVRFEKGEAMRYPGVDVGEIDREA